MKKKSIFPLRIEKTKTWQGSVIIDFSYISPRTVVENI